MKNVVKFMACILISSLAFQACSSGAKVQKEVETAIQAYSSVNASVKDGVVTLTGTVDTDSQKMAVENVVRSVKGVKSVTNNITLNQSPDSMLQSSISQRYQTEGFSTVQVSVNNREVTLSGNLKRSDLQRVMQIANESGAARVINNLNLE